MAVRVIEAGEVADVGEAERETVGGWFAIVIWTTVYLENPGTVMTKVLFVYDTSVQPVQGESSRRI